MVDTAGMFEHGFLIAIGIWITLVGYRVIRGPSKPGVDYEGWIDKYGATLRWCGPMVVVINVVLMVADAVVGRGR